VDIGFEDEPRRRLEVRTDIPEEIMMEAIAEQFGVSESMELVVAGLQSIKRYDVSRATQYTLYRVETLKRLEPQHVVRARTVGASSRAATSLVMCQGMREERVQVWQDTTKSEMVRRLVEQFRAGGGQWTIRVETSTRDPADYCVARVGGTFLSPSAGRRSTPTCGTGSRSGAWKSQRGRRRPR
jgi:hypothetical protein